jgi:D-glycero-alpha-D-manno-heptose-7-phosphate kinase
LIMLIARAPLRISFGGGGTDLEAYYSKYGGMVVSAAINKYFYAIISSGDFYDLQIISSDYHSLYRLPPNENLFWDGDLALPKAIVHHFGIRKGLSIFIASEVPPGTGLGSSSSVAVTLIKALSTICEKPLTREQIGDLAAYIEIDKLGMPIGKQDQYASSCGGLNVIRFSRDGVVVEPLAINRRTMFHLEDRLMLFFTGSARNSGTILSKQKSMSERNGGRVVESLHRIKHIAEDMKGMLENGDLTDFGQLLHESWETKKNMVTGITNQHIEECYELARQHGASGGKITGAGGGGFLMLYCELERQEEVTRALETKGLRRMNFRFDQQGAQVILNIAAFNRNWIEAFPENALVETAETTKEA